MPQRSGLRVPPLLVLLLLGGLVLAVERLVVTDPEAIEAVVDRGVEAVRQGDWPGLRALLADAYQGEGGDADGGVARVQALWRSYEPLGLAATVLSVQVEGDRATAPTNVRARVVGRPVALHLELGFVREPGGWKVLSARPGDLALPR